MAEKLTRTYYRIRFPAKAGTYAEFYASNNGTSQWAEVAKVKSLLRRGQPKGYKGSILVPFEGHEVLKITENVDIETEVVAVA